MSKIVVYLLCFGVITIQTSGQTNSDPAPGRSPGPPGMNTLQDAHGNTDNEDGGTLLLTQDQSEDFSKKVKIVSKCENKLQSFLVQSSENESGKVVLLDESNINANENVDLKVEVIHEIFETKNGINCGLMYKIQVSTVNILGDFLVETTSRTSGTARGSFVDRNLSNKLPISWFKTNFIEGINWSSEELSSRMESDEIDKNSNERRSNDDEDVVFEDDIEENVVEPNVYSENVNDESNFLVDTDANIRLMNHKEPNYNDCNKNVWLGKLHTQGTNHTNSAFLWILNDFCDQEDTIEFRTFFRYYSNITKSPIVLQKTFSIHLNKDCHLNLKSSGGSLDFTSLPLYSSDCEVNFPSYQDLPSTTAGPPPPGILVNLQRLNVPCNSGSYVRIANSEKVICGKLEELNSNERTYHFDIQKSSKIQFFKNPMFSLTYKLVDYCYNLTLTNETGEFYITPMGRETLECYFHIHLPYGNKIDLQLVVNNRSAVDRTSGNNRVNIISLRSRRPPVNVNVNSFFYPSDNYFRDNSRTSNEAPVSCGGEIFIQIYESVDVESKWTKCVNNETSGAKQYHFVSESNRLIVHLIRQRQTEKITPSNTNYSISESSSSSSSVSASASSATVFFTYVAKPISEIVSECAFGWIAMQQFCIKPFHVLKSWTDAESECSGFGGHLTSIRTESEQHSIDTILMNRLRPCGFRFLLWTGYGCFLSRL
ncbi:hypothetical protein ACFFRR_001879 [Megaselia abdita]